ncbi:GNAT family N-acetyltransferase [Flavobacterium sp.]|uniref:GNAT family N-acetyltransferase n=1 Tax=Flavobacterium sp. TaxID=239 RepID=UPI003D0A5A6F
MNNSNHLIREIGLKEFGKVKQIIADSGLILDEFMGGNQSLALLEYKLERNQCKIFITQVHEEVSGFIVLLAKRNILTKLSYDWHIAYLCVKDEYRRNRIGERLLDFTIDFAVATKANELSLYTNKDNLPAIHLYRKKGFLESNFLANYLTYKLMLNDFR